MIRRIDDRRRPGKISTERTFRCSGGSTGACTQWAKFTTGTLPGDIAEARALGWSLTRRGWTCPACTASHPATVGPRQIS